MIHHIHIILKYLDMIVQTCTRCRSWTCFIQPCTINPTFGHDLSKLGSKIQTWIKSIRKIGKYSNQKKFIGERGRINCSLRDISGFWRWLGIQFVISDK